MTHLVWLLPAIPVIAAVLGPSTDRFMPGGPVVVAGVGGFATLGFACWVLSQQWGSAVTHETQTRWTPAGSFDLGIGTSVDQVSASLVVVVALVALVVQIYSASYMAGDPHYGAYAAEVSLFTGAMLLTVVASSLLELLVGWEVMGLCSYLLVGHYWQTEGARAAAVKALITTRIGDAAFLVGIILLGTGSGTFDINDIDRTQSLLHATSSSGGFEGKPGPAIISVNPFGTHVFDANNPGFHLASHTVLVVATLLLLGGVVGKSAQFPLHTWLPDAMAGPTPISALIHAATMVAAGVFFVMRLYPVFQAASVSLTVLGIIACISMLGAALAALAQDDLKRVLAYSTISQLGYMFAGLAVGGGQASFYQLLGHALFKSLLFLAAGSVLRGVGSNLMSDMGGLWRRMPLTFVTMVIGGLALAGVPPLPGYWGKASIIAAASAHGGGIGHAIVIVGDITEIVTAAYVTRMIGLTFFGEERTKHRVHESSRVMTFSLAFLSLGTIAYSFLGRGGPHDWLIGAPVLASSVVGHGIELFIPIVLVAAGIAVVASLLVARRGADPALALGPLHRVFEHGFYVDNVYDAALVRPVRRIASSVVEIDRRGIDATAVGTGRAASLLGAGFRLAQNGNVQLYATGLIGGVLAIVIAVALAVSR